MIWIHCGDTGEVPSSLSLATRLSDQSHGVGILLTGEADVIDMIGTAPRGVTLAQVPVDSPAKTRAFGEEYKLSYLIWNGGALRPVLLRWVEKAKLPATFINARTSGLLKGGSRWLPGATRAAVSAFDRILTTDGATATRLIRGGVARATIDVTGPILEEPMAMLHDQNEFTVMSEALDSRPMWFAADVVPAEITHMAAAHLLASRKNHRLLLLITPRDTDSGPKVAALLREAGLKVGVRSEGDDPTAEHQAYVADLEGEIGLWYRAAPLTFIGGTLSGGDAASPFEPIALGSAVIHGTHKAPHEARFARLAQAEASREIRSASELGIAVSTLISPEQTARMALAGWEELTRNAQTLNGLVRLALDVSEGAA